MSRDFEKDYIKETDSFAPDMDKLWDRISSEDAADADITPFADAARQCLADKSRRIKNILKGFASAAAVFAVFAVSVILSGRDTDFSVSDNGAAVNISQGEEIEAVEKSALDEYPAGEVQTYGLGWDYSSGFDFPENLSYSSLNLAETDSGIYTALSGNNEEQEYFVEQTVLEKTEFFIDGKVIESRPADNSRIVYTLETIHIVSEEEREIGETVEVYSASPYALRNNREYLLPVREENGMYTVIFDNAPQIEFTLDRAVVCHNGWSSLSKGSRSIEYSKVYKDDYFYDRMNIASEDTLENLFDKWKRTRR